MLVDTGVGGLQQALDDWRVVNRSVADALADLDMSPADVGLVINTRLTFDHCGQNGVFRHAPFYGQRAELSRCGASRGICTADSASWTPGGDCWTGTRGSCLAMR